MKLINVLLLDLFHQLLLLALALSLAKFCLFPKEICLLPVFSNIIPKHYNLLFVSLSFFVKALLLIVQFPLDVLLHRSYLTLQLLFKVSLLSLLMLELEPSILGFDNKLHNLLVSLS